MILKLLLNSIFVILLAITFNGCNSDEEKTGGELNLMGTEEDDLPEDIEITEEQKGSGTVTVRVPKGVTKIRGELRLGNKDSDEDEEEDLEGESESSRRYDAPYRSRHEEYTEASEYHSSSKKKRKEIRVTTTQEEVKHEIETCEACQTNKDNLIRLLNLVNKNIDDEAETHKCVQFDTVEDFEEVVNAVRNSVKYIKDMENHFKAGIARSSMINTLMAVQNIMIDEQRKDIFERCKEIIVGLTNIVIPGQEFVERKPTYRTVRNEEEVEVEEEDRDRVERSETTVREAIRETTALQSQLAVVTEQIQGPVAVGNYGWGDKKMSMTTGIAYLEMLSNAVNKHLLTEDASGLATHGIPATVHALRRAVESASFNLKTTNGGLNEMNVANKASCKLMTGHIRNYDENVDVARLAIRLRQMLQEKITRSDLYVKNVIAQFKTGVELGIQMQVFVNPQGFLETLKEPYEMLMKLFDQSHYRGFSGTLEGLLENLDYLACQNPSSISEEERLPLNDEIKEFEHYINQNFLYPSQLFREVDHIADLCKEFSD